MRCSNDHFEAQAETVPLSNCTNLDLLLLLSIERSLLARPPVPSQSDIRQNQTELASQIRRLKPKVDRKTIAGAWHYLID